MSPGSEKTECSKETESFEGQHSQKLFDNYGPVNIREAVGTAFLGALALLLFIALQRSWQRYEELLSRSRVER